MLLTFRNERLKAAVVFIHGFGGDAAHSWLKFQQLLIADPRAKEWDCFSFGYQSFRTQLHVVAYDFYRSLTSPPLAHYERIAIVAHSTGCLAPDFLDTELSVFMQRLQVQEAAGEPGLA